jgi:hypothetical protein
MAQQIINVGAVPNDGQGDPIRTAFQKTNSNFGELYSRAQTNPPTSLTGEAGDVAGMYAYDATYFYYCFANYDGSSTIWAQVTQVANISSSQINSGNSNVVISGAGGNIVMAVNGVANVAVFTPTTANIVGNVTSGGYFFGNGALLTGLPQTYANANVQAYAESGWAGNIIPAANAAYSLGNPSALFKDLYLSNSSLYLGNVVLTSTDTSLLVNGNTVFTANSPIAGNVSVTGNISGNNVNATNNLSVTNTAYIFDISSTGTAALTTVTAATVSATGTVTGGNISTAGSITATGNIAAGNMSATNLNISNVITDLGPLSLSTTTANANINLSPNGTGIVTVSSTLSATGNITGNFISGNGSQLTGVDVTSIQNGNSNVTTFANGNVTVSSAGVANVLEVTSTGTITSGTASVTGTVTGGNIVTTGTVSATGNITGGNLSGANLTGTLLTASQLNITSVGTLGSLSIIGTVTGGNIATAGTVSATSNITTAGNLSVTGNVTTSGLISATGNITGNNVNIGNLSLTGNVLSNANFDGNVIVASNINSFNITATGNMQAGYANINTTAGVDVYSGNLRVTEDLGQGGSISATGNITANNTMAFANVAVLGGNPLAATDTTIAYKIPVTINGNVYYIALTAAQ